MQIPLTVAKKTLPLDCHPADFLSIQDKLRSRSNAPAVNLVLEDFPDPDRPDWNGFRLPQAFVFPRQSQRWSSK